MQQINKALIGQSHSQTNLALFAPVRLSKNSSIKSNHKNGYK